MSEADSLRDPTPDAAARAAGVLLLTTAAVTVVAVATRVSAAADQPTMVQTITAIAARPGLYAAGGAARAVSGITLIAAAWLLLRTWIMRRRLATPLVPLLFAGSGLITAVSGACAVALAAVAATSPLDATLPAASAALSAARALSGKIGFAAAGLALLMAARFQWRVGDTLRRIAPVTAVLGAAMQFIWLDAATIVHPIVGTLFLLWLAVIGGMLLSGRVERHYARLARSAGDGFDLR